MNKNDLDRFSNELIGKVKFDNPEFTLKDSRRIIGKAYTKISKEVRDAKEAEDSTDKD